MDPTGYSCKSKGESLAENKTDVTPNPQDNGIENYSNIQNQPNRPTTVNPSGFDLIENDTRLSGRPYQGLEQLRNELAERGIRLEFNNEFLDDNNANGGFDAENGIMVLREDATYYEVMHEYAHYTQYSELGREAYLAQTRREREQFVFDMLENDRNIWESLNEQERRHAINYIYVVGGFR